MTTMADIADKHCSETHARLDKPKQGENWSREEDRIALDGRKRGLSTAAIVENLAAAGYTRSANGCRTRLNCIDVTTRIKQHGNDKGDGFAIWPKAEDKRDARLIGNVINAVFGENHARECE